MRTILQFITIAIVSLLAGCGAGDHYAPAGSPTTRPAQPKRAVGVGGVFFKANDPKALKAWYANHLGFQTDEYGTNFESRQADDPSRKAFLQWSPFPARTKYFGPSTKEFMINYRVENLEWLMQQLRAEGVSVIGEIKVESYGKFAHIMDPEGNKIELWEPIESEYDKAVKGRTK